MALSFGLKEQGGPASRLLLDRGQTFAFLKRARPVLQVYEMVDSRLLTAQVEERHCWLDLVFLRRAAKAAPAAITRRWLLLRECSFLAKGAGQELVEVRRVEGAAT